MGTLEEGGLCGVGLPVQFFGLMSGFRRVFGLAVERTGLMIRGFAILTCSMAVSVIKAKSLSIGGCGRCLRLRADWMQLLARTIRIMIIM